MAPAVCVPSIDEVEAPSAEEVEGEVNMAVAWGGGRSCGGMEEGWRRRLRVWWQWKLGFRT